MFETPILFLVFNRPKETKIVLDQILKINPSRLFVAADGPRTHVDGEKEKCNEVRQLISSSNFHGELITLYREENLGCRKSVSSAIQWFFENVEQGIIIEDDCLPDLSFFLYAEILLNKYKNNQKILSIGGHNLGYNQLLHSSYGFSKYMNMWGWATWKRCSNLIDYELSEWQSKSPFEKRYTLLFKISTPFTKEFDWGWLLRWIDIFDKTSRKEIDTWDYQWFYHSFSHKKLSIFPAVNLVENLGFNENATHTTSYNSNIAELKSHKIEFPIIDPDKIFTDFEYQEKHIKKVWSFYNRLPLVFHIKHGISKRIKNTLLKKK